MGHRILVDGRARTCRGRSTHTSRPLNAPSTPVQRQYEKSGLGPPRRENAGHRWGHPRGSDGASPVPPKVESFSAGTENTFQKRQGRDRCARRRMGSDLDRRVRTRSESKVHCFSGGGTLTRTGPQASGGTAVHTAIPRIHRKVVPRRWSRVQDQARYAGSRPGPRRSPACGENAPQLPSTLR